MKDDNLFHSHSLIGEIASEALYEKWYLFFFVGKIQHYLVTNVGLVIKKSYVATLC